MSTLTPGLTGTMTVMLVSVKRYQTGDATTMKTTLKVEKLVKPSAAEIVSNWFPFLNIHWIIAAVTEDLNEVL